MACIRPHPLESHSRVLDIYRVEMDRTADDVLGPSLTKTETVSMNYGEGTRRRRSKDVEYGGPFKTELERREKNKEMGNMPVSREEQEMFDAARPKYLKASDLKDGGKVKIADVNYNPNLRGGPGYIVDLEGVGVATLNMDKKHSGKLPLNQTNREIVEKKSGSKKPNDWVGLELTVNIQPGTRNPQTGTTVDGVRFK